MWHYVWVCCLQLSHSALKQSLTKTIGFRRIIASNLILLTLDQWNANSNSLSRYFLGWLWASYCESGYQCGAWINEWNPFIFDEFQAEVKWHIRHLFGQQKLAIHIKNCAGSCQKSEHGNQWFESLGDSAVWTSLNTFCFNTPFCTVLRLVGCTVSG